MKKKIALVQGINDFPGTINDLNGCKQDAIDVTLAVSQAGFDFKTLIDKQVTRSAVISALKEMFAVTQPGDSILFWNSTHGTQVPDVSGDEADGMDEAICVISDDQKQIALIYDDELWSLFKLKKPGVQFVMFSDSCHSGTVARLFDPLF